MQFYRAIAADFLPAANPFAVLPEEREKEEGKGKSDQKFHAETGLYTLRPAARPENRQPPRKVPSSAL